MQQYKFVTTIFFVVIAMFISAQNNTQHTKAKSWIVTGSCEGTFQSSSRAAIYERNSRAVRLCNLLIKK